MMGSPVQQESAEIVRVLKGIELTLLFLFSLRMIWFGAWIISVLAR